MQYSDAPRRDLRGKVALVTGAAGGLGSASTRRLAAAGATLVLTDINAAGLQRVLDSLPGGAAAHLAVDGDIAHEATMQRCLQQAGDRFGHIDLWHLNAGLPGAIASIPDTDTDDFDRVVAVNLRGTFLGLRVAFQHLEDRRATGAIAVTSSIAGLRGSADLLAYQASKHGVIGLVHGAAVYGGPLGVRVNAVAPGIVPTDLFGDSTGSVGAGADMVQRATTTPLRRAGTPEEIAAAVEFLLSDDASYITGQVLSVDGGASVVSIVRPSGGAGRWPTAAHDQALYGPTASRSGAHPNEGEEER